MLIRCSPCEVKFNRKCTSLCPHGQFEVRVRWWVKSRYDLLGGGDESANQGNQEQQEAGGPYLSYCTQRAVWWEQGGLLNNGLLPGNCQLERYRFLLIMTNIYGVPPICLTVTWYIYILFHFIESSLLLVINGKTLLKRTIICSCLCWSCFCTCWLRGKQGQKKLQQSKYNQVM